MSAVSMKKIAVIVDPKGTVRETGFPTEEAARIRCDEKNEHLRSRIPEVVGVYWRVQLIDEVQT